MTLLYIPLFLGVPALMLLLVHRLRWARRIGVVLLCYLGGLTLGNSGLLPAAAGSVASQVAEAAVALALPLLLFTLDVRAWRRLAGPAMLSMLLAVVAVVTTATLLFVLFDRAGVARAHELAGLSVGVYTGGTPNLAAIKTGLEVDEARYLLLHSFDMLVSGLYLLFMLSLAPLLFRRWLPAFARSAGAAAAPVPIEADEDYRALLERRSWAGIGQALGLSVAVVVAALALSRLLPGPQAAVTIVLLTTLAIGAGLFERVRRLAHAYKLGMYLIYVFSFAVASMARFRNLGDVELAPLLFLLATAAGTLCLHALLCRLFRVDADTFMVTSVAAICSPPFVPMMAKTLANPGVLLSGIAAGIVGYALGNYLGITLGLLLAG